MLLNAQEVLVIKSKLDHIINHISKQLKIFRNKVTGSDIIKNQKAKFVNLILTSNNILFIVFPSEFMKSTSSAGNPQ